MRAIVTRSMLALRQRDALLRHGWCQRHFIAAAACRSRRMPAGTLRTPARIITRTAFTAEKASALRVIITVSRTRGATLRLLLLRLLLL